ncbi:Terpenoid cyclases prenyltransferase alpha-alpha toroid protein [Rutstroemia sp. NJR-2017a BBW]|nr:Terpenoid cyclases prenyltransferase alpha-alpha toroid protein [Rutstroemia sp. NJR-2017a BBW]
MSKNHNNIPLHCSICPKNPRFSDVSHLLTHTSSKAHLSNYFKLKIRAASEISAKVQLDKFEDWYANHDLERLLSDRLASKDQKKAAKDRKTKPKAMPSKIKKENDHILDDESNLAPMFRAPVPRMHLWPTIPNSNMSASTNTNTNTSTSEMGSEWEQNAIYATPTTRRQVPGYSHRETPLRRRNASIADKLMTPFKPEGTDDVVEEKLSDSTKLKGVLWPGMDLFDSATAEMKRMRNQRKDGSILESMIAASADVEPTEVSYHADGAFRTARNIFGPLSTETSPVRDPTPKRRKPRKAALANLSVNVPRLRASRSQRNNHMASPEKRQRPAKHREPTGQLSLHPPPTLNPLAFGSRFTPSNEDEEFRLTVGDMGRKKRSFGIFHDAPEISPGRTESPLEDHPFDFSDNTTSGFADTTLDNISPTPVVKPTAMRMLDKENNQANNQMRRNMTSSHGMPSSGMFYDSASMYNPLYSHHPRAFTYHGDHTGMAQMEQESKPMTGFTSTFHGNFNSIGSSPHLSSGHLPHSNTNGMNHGTTVNMPHFGM